MYNVNGLEMYIEVLVHFKSSNTNIFIHFKISISKFAHVSRPLGSRNTKYYVMIFVRLNLSNQLENGLQDEDLACQPFRDELDNLGVQRQLLQRNIIFILPYTFDIRSNYYIC